MNGLSAMNVFICISGQIKKQVVSYTYICADTLRNITSAVLVKNRGKIKNRVSSEERPQIVDEKGRIGSWEIDTIIGKGHRGALVTIVERVSQFTVSTQVAGKTAKSKPSLQRR